MEVAAHVDAVEQGALLAEGLLVELFGRGGEQDGRVVSEDASEDLEMSY